MSHADEMKFRVRDTTPTKYIIRHDEVNSSSDGAWNFPLTQLKQQQCPVSYNYYQQRKLGMNYTQESCAPLVDYSRVVD